MEYNELLKNIEQWLFCLDADARHVIELKETFTFPAYDTSIRELIKETNKVWCYTICLNAIYFEFIMALMRMYDSYERDTVCFKKLFEYLSNDFIEHFERNTQRAIRTEIETALEEYNGIKGSHFMGGLKTVRHNILAHTSTNFDRNQVAEYGDGEKLLARTLPMLNRLNLAIRGKTEPYDKISDYWKGYAIEFWQSMLNSGQQITRADGG